MNGLLFRLTFCVTRVMSCEISIPGNSFRHLLRASMKGEHCFWSSCHHTFPMGEIRSMFTRPENGLKEKYYILHNLSGNLACERLVSKTKLQGSFLKKTNSCDIWCESQYFTSRKYLFKIK